MANKNATKSLSRAERVRILLKEGRSVQEAAATVGVTKQYVYNVKYKLNKMQNVGAKPGVRISEKTGKPVRKYTKRKKSKRVARVDKTTMLELDRNRMKDELFDLRETNEQLVKQIQEATKPKVVYREVSVPQPFSHYTFTQRLGILFFGRTPS